MSDHFMDSLSLEFNGFLPMHQPHQDSSEVEDLRYNMEDSKQEQMRTSLSIKQIINNDNRKRRLKTKSKAAKRISKTKAQKQSSYKKNICGYITKKVIREFIYGNYKRIIQEICDAEHADIKAAQDYYESKIESVTGPSHLSALFTASRKEDIPLLRVFVRFFQWFLQQRYVRHLFLQGKMQIKKAYIEYKNKKLLPAVMQYEKSLEHENENFSTINAPGEQSPLL